MSQQLHALPPGYEIEGYRIEGTLGTGGFGVTYLAREMSLDRLVAIKEYLPADISVRDTHHNTVHPIDHEDEETFEWGLERFRGEALTLVSFRHANIVAVLRFFEANGTAYMVMDYEEGSSLGEILQGAGTLPEHEMHEILFPLLDGLDRVHRAGFLHRDIKPDNIYIRADGSPVLLDFGAARLAVGQKGQQMTGLVTVGYAPPEQYDSGSPQGPWTDIYAFGATLYHAVTGTIPVESTARMGALARREADPLASVEERAALKAYGAPLMHAVDWSLAILGADRPQSVAEWRAAFRAPDRTRAEPVGPAPRRRRKRAETIAPWEPASSDPAGIADEEAAAGKGATLLADGVPDVPGPDYEYAAPTVFEAPLKPGERPGPPAARHRGGRLARVAATLVAVAVVAFGVHLVLGEDPIEACDRHAAHPFDPRKPRAVPGVTFGQMEAEKAAAACAEAARKKPDLDRLRFNHARALHKLKRYAEARAIYQALAARGYVFAEANIAYMIFRGQGGPRNAEEGARRFQLAAIKGNPDAQLALAGSYMWGRGVERDDVAAYFWYRLASRFYPVAAKPRLETLRSRLDAAQISEIERRLTAWKPTS
ncbi:MAG TPA: protein kinase [Methyloceanibacter sp.]|nr:protein kinase [Methyloceanibacter sp.]